MSPSPEDVEVLKRSDAPLRVHTLGAFHAWRDSASAETLLRAEIAPATWGRDKALQLFQFFLTVRGRHLHKEQIVDRIWPELDWETSDRDFRVALNAVFKALEPERKPRAESRFVRRHGGAYGLDMAQVWVDADAFESLVIDGNSALPGDVDAAIGHYRAAVDLYGGDYLPERRYTDWASVEQERLQVLALGTMTTLAGLLVDRSPLESVRLAQRVLAEDPVWEDAYRAQMRAYAAQGNRPLALRTYRQCVEVLDREFGVEPLPETRMVYLEIEKLGSGE
jgi:two-component SAPR family response regulator